MSDFYGPHVMGYHDRIPMTKSNAVAQSVLERLDPRCRSAAGTMCFRVGRLQRFRWNLAGLLCRAADNLLALVCCCEPIGTKP
jgi:hypothetical protein